MQNITTIKLISGDEIIGRLVESNAETLILSKPVQLVASQKGIGFAPICISIDDASEFTFKHAHILFSANTRSELEDAYIKSTTGIQLASSLS